MLIVFGIGATAAAVSSGNQLIIIVLMFIVTLICAILDALAILNYPAVLRDPGRKEMEAYFQTLNEMQDLATRYENKTQEMMAVEEEKIRARDKQIQEMKTEIFKKEDDLAVEEENLRVKQNEFNQVTAELEKKTGQILEEQENLKIREQEMSSRLEREYKSQAEDFLAEEEEKLRTRESELVKLKEESNVKAELYDESQEKLRRKEEELGTLKTKLEGEIRNRLQEEEKTALAKAVAKKEAERRVIRILFPFNAIVGQELMKKALIW